jgi:hypothetical protein
MHFLVVGMRRMQKVSKGHFMGFSSDTTEATFVVSMVLQEIDRSWSALLLSNVFVFLGSGDKKQKSIAN